MYMYSTVLCRSAGDAAMIMTPGFPNGVDAVKSIHGKLGWSRRVLSASPNADPCSDKSPPLDTQKSKVFIVNTEQDLLDALGTPSVEHIEVRQHLDLTRRGIIRATNDVQSRTKSIRVRSLDGYCQER